MLARPLKNCVFFYLISSCIIFLSDIHTKRSTICYDLAWEFIRSNDGSTVDRSDELTNEELSAKIRDRKKKR